MQFAPTIEIVCTRPGGYAIQGYDPAVAMARTLALGRHLQPPAGWTRHGYLRHVRRSLARGEAPIMPRLVGIFRGEFATEIRGCGKGRPYRPWPIGRRLGALPAACRVRQ